MIDRDVGCEAFYRLAIEIAKSDQSFIFIALGNRDRSGGEAKRTT